ncbi:hypothetical protein [Aerolutibacter daejeonensis]|uniref:hypothetical protein n=1 Tax=Aerolutibacter daejeonensis TaxID=346181 RepID=UPI0018DC3FB2|nr:hypothetical protein [Lysobacter daejeonensis]
MPVVMVTHSADVVVLVAVLGRTALVTQGATVLFGNALAVGLGMAIRLGLALLVFNQAALLRGGQARAGAVATRVLTTLTTIAVHGTALIDVAPLLCHPIQVAPGGATSLIVLAHLPRLRTVVLACATGLERTARLGIGLALPCLLFAGLGFPLLAEGSVTPVAGACSFIALFAFGLLGHALRPRLFAPRVALLALRLLPSAPALGGLGPPLPLGLGASTALRSRRMGLGSALRCLIRLGRLHLAGLIRPVFVACATAFAAPWMFVLLVALRLLRANGRRHGKQSADHHREQDSLAVTVHVVSPGWAADHPHA